jgi:hypothetical protein
VPPVGALFLLLSLFIAIASVVCSCFGVVHDLMAFIKLALTRELLAPTLAQFFSRELKLQVSFNLNFRARYVSTLLLFSHPFMIDNP